MMEKKGNSLFFCLILVSVIILFPLTSTAGRVPLIATHQKDGSENHGNDRDKIAVQSSQSKTAPSRIDHSSPSDDGRDKIGVRGSHSSSAYSATSHSPAGATISVANPKRPAVNNVAAKPYDCLPQNRECRRVYKSNP